MFPGQCGNTAFFFKSQPDQFHFEFRGIVFPGKSFFSAHEVSTCKISGCLSYRILDSGPDGTQTTLTAMRTHKLNKSRKLYRSDNTTTRHYSINPGGEYRWGRNRKKAEDELLAKRETMHGRQKRGRDYTPLFYFLVKQIGQPWDKVFSEVCGRLDTTEPVFWLVALHEHQKRDLVRIGDSSFYPGLFVDGNGILQQVNPSITGKDVKVICRCCTHTYMGEPVPGKYE